MSFWKHMAMVPQKKEVKYEVRTERAGVAVTFLICILEVLVLNLSGAIGYSDAFRGFPYVKNYICILYLLKTYMDVPNYINITPTQMGLHTLLYSLAATTLKDHRNNVEILVCLHI
jgi:phosphatidylserine synthase